MLKIINFSLMLALASCGSTRKERAFSASWVDVCNTLKKETKECEINMLSLTGSSVDYARILRQFPEVLIVVNIDSDDAEISGKISRSDGVEVLKLVRTKADGGKVILKAPRMLPPGEYEVLLSAENGRLNGIVSGRFTIARSADIKDITVCKLPDPVSGNCTSAKKVFSHTDTELYATINFGTLSPTLEMNLSVDKFFSENSDVLGTSDFLHVDKSQVTVKIPFKTSPKCNDGNYVLQANYMDETKYSELLVALKCK